MRLLRNRQKYLQVLCVNTVLTVLLIRPCFVINIIFITLSNFYEFIKKTSCFAICQQPRYNATKCIGKQGLPVQ